VAKIWYSWPLLLDQFRFCETHFTTWFVADQSAIKFSPFLGDSWADAGMVIGIQKEILIGIKKLPF